MSHDWYGIYWYASLRGAIEKDNFEFRNLICTLILTVKEESRDSYLLRLILTCYIKIISLQIKLKKKNVNLKMCSGICMKAV